MNSFWRIFAACLLVAACTLSGETADAAVTSTSLHAAEFGGFDGLLSDNDLIQGLNAEPEVFGDPGVYENPGDTGWHPANTNPLDQLPAFTDGLGGVRNFTGLLNDNLPPGQVPPQPVSGAPVKVVEYVLAESSDVGRINILSGNRVNSDGRIFMTTSIMYSLDGGNTFAELGYFQSDPSGVVNSENNPVAPFEPPQASTFTSIFDDASPTLLSGVTNIEFSFYAADADGLGLHGDPFDGINTFTDEDDGISAAFVSPLIWEIDVLPPSEGITGDYNGDGTVNIADYTVWRDTLGSTVDNGTGADGNENGLVDQGDYDVWKLGFGNPGAFQNALGGITAVPEPASSSWILAGLLSLMAWRFRRDNLPNA